MAPKGQRASHLRHPTQRSALCKVENLRHPWGCKLNRCRWHVGTHQPQPVQRAESITGIKMERDVFMPAMLKPETSQSPCRDRACAGMNAAAVKLWHRSTAP
jgi:hypothetical protein